MSSRLGRWVRSLVGLPAGLSCRELVELVTDYSEDALPAGERRRFEALFPAARETLLNAFRDWKAR